MRESYSEDLTSYAVPESYADGGDTVGVATAGVLAGKLLSSEIIISVCRIGDNRILRSIRKWLHAGVIEEGVWSSTEVGSPQGSVISPILANVFLHYVFDLWIEWWRHQSNRGDVVVVRYADDCALGNVPTR